MLLSGRCTLTGFRADPLRVLISSRGLNTIAAVGPPPQDSRDLPSRMGSEILVQQNQYEPWAAALSGWRSEIAILHRQRPGGGPARHESDVRLMEAGDLVARSDLPERLKEELALSWSPIAATFLAGRPVSFCYAASETEAWWDISIETLPEYRRRSAATACTVRLIQWMRQQRKKEPVWGALESNTASLKLARHLGFEPLDRIWVFEPHTA